jgi:hypothetical protein
MDCIKVFNQWLKSCKAKGYLIERRECRQGPIKACKSLIIELWWHQRGKNILIHTFEKKGVIIEEKKDASYAVLEEEVLYYLFDKKEEILKYGV